MPDDQNWITIEVIIEEFLDRRRRGEDPRISEYVKKYPELADEIQEVLPAISMVENIKLKQHYSQDGRINLGAARRSRLGEYKIIREIGRGGMGIIYEAEQESLKRRVALKVLPMASMMNDKSVKRFQTEALISARLQHPNIVTVFSVGQEQNLHFIVMQLINGVSWDRLIDHLAEGVEETGGFHSRQVLDHKKPLLYLTRHILEEDASQHESDTRAGLKFGLNYFNEAVDLSLQAADALGHAHEEGVLHRDIKPANFMLDQSGHVWITDFGLAKARQQEDLTTSGNLMGTMRFMAPEQFDGRTDARSDLYSFGLTLYELLTLRPAFQGKTQSELIHKILYGRPDPPRQVNPDIPPDLEAVILKATDKNPELRYQTVRQLAQDLHNYKNGLPIQAQPKPVPPPIEVEPSGRALNRIIGAGLIILLLFIGGIWFKSFMWPEDVNIQPKGERPAPIETKGDIAGSATDESLPEDGEQTIEAGIPDSQDTSPSSISIIPDREDAVKEPAPVVKEPAPVVKESTRKQPPPPPTRENETRKPPPPDRQPPPGSRAGNPPPRPPHLPPKHLPPPGGGPHPGQPPGQPPPRPEQRP